MENKAYLLKKDTLYTDNGKLAIIPAGTTLVKISLGGYMTVGGVAIYPADFVENNSQWFEEAKDKPGTPILHNQYSGKEVQLIKVERRFYTPPNIIRGVQPKEELKRFAEGLGQIIISKYPPNQWFDGEEAHLELSMLVIPLPNTKS